MTYLSFQGLNHVSQHKGLCEGVHLKRRARMTALCHRDEVAVTIFCSSRENEPELKVPVQFRKLSANGR